MQHAFILIDEFNMFYALMLAYAKSLIVISVQYEYGLIDKGLYSIIIASSILFKFIVPPLFANLLVRWDIAKTD